jgi:hypothetical protein
MGPALREAVERHTGVSTDNLSYVAPRQPSPPPFGWPTVSNPQWPRTFGAGLPQPQSILSSLLSPPGLAQAAIPTQTASTYASKLAPLLPSRMPDSGVSAVARMAGEQSPLAGNQSPPAPVPVGYQDTERRWPGYGPPPTIWDPWAEQFIKGMQGFINSIRPNSNSGTRRLPNTDYCHERFDQEEKRCGEKFPEPEHERWWNACRERAQERRRQCIANGGKPRLGEPPEYDWDDVPEDFPPSK